MPRPDDNQKNYARWMNDMTTVAYTGTSARTSSALPQGTYWLRATTNCYIKQGSSTVTATTSSNYLVAGERMRMDVTGDNSSEDSYVAAIRENTSGTLQIYAPK